MLTENQVRELLVKAGETVEVAPKVADIEPSPRRFWPVAAAALAVAATVVALFVAVGLNGDSTRTDSPQPVVTPNADELPPSPQHYELGPNQMPLLFGWTVEDARAELESRGFVVQVRTSTNLGCRAQDRVWSTDPAVGVSLQEGGSISLTTSDPAVRCLLTEPADYDLAWSLLDFAEGRGPAPRFAGDLTLWLGDRFSRTITAQQAEDPDNWVVCSDNGVVCGSALHDLVEHQYHLLNDAARMPYLEIDRGESTFTWGGPILRDGVPTVLGGRLALRISTPIPIDGFFPFPSVDVFENDGVIDAVAIWTGLNPDGSAGIEVPDVVGLPGAHAQFQLMEAGFGWEATVEQVDDCEDRGIVVDQQPDGGTLVRTGTRPTLSVCGTDDISADADQVGYWFVRVVRGSYPLGRSPFADVVDLYLGNRFVKTITTPFTEESWEVCPPEGDGYAERSCPLSAWDAIRTSRWPVVYSGMHPVLGACAAGDPDAELPSGRFVTLGVGEPDSCMNNWNVELYYDADGVITAVNLLLGSP